MFKRIKPTCYERNDGIDHPDKQCINTRVSEYLRKYGTGQLDQLPTDSRPEVRDDRTTDEMLADGQIVPGLGTDELDIMMEIDAMRERFQAALDDIELTKADRVKFDKAMDVLDNRNASDDQKRDAYRILAELEKRNRVSRV